MVISLNRIKSFFKENWKFLLFLVFFYILMNYELPYVIYSPGGSIDMSERVSGDNIYNESGSFSMTYVSMIKGSLPFIGLSYIFPDWDLESTKNVSYNGDNFDETVEIDKIYMKEAISNAELVAYKAAGINYSVKSTKNLVTNKINESQSELKYGDEILRVDNIYLNNLKELQDYVATKNIGDTIKIVYKRDNKEYVDNVTLVDIDGYAKVGIGIATINEYDTFYNIVVETKNSESGPSGGLMTALEIYNKITLDDITNGMKIMGTGTIDADGNVGEIGGVKYKLIGAVRNGANVFVCPKENYEEAIKEKKKKNYDIMIIEANTFSDVIKKLKNMK